jgi:cell division protein FtsI/penicillin-binding protein 2
VAKGRSSLTRRGRIALHALPLIVAAVAAFSYGASKGSSYAPGRDAANRFVKAWARGDFAAMYAELGKTSAERYSRKRFDAAYVDAAQKATITAIAAKGAQGPGSYRGARVVSVPMAIRTSAYGVIAAPLILPLEGDSIAWSPNLVFPGLQPGQRLERRVDLPPRASILTRTGAALASGPPANRVSSLGEAAKAIAGQIGQPDPASVAAQVRAGFPATALAGISGLEKAFNLRLGGQPGGDLLAVGAGTGQQSQRVIAHGPAKPAPPLKTTIDPTLQIAAVRALAGQPGGIAVLDARDGSVRALAGSAFSAPQPPGSTFKIVTTSAALEAHVVRLGDRFPIVQKIAIGGREIANAHDEFCGGTFSQGFAHSCNSIFAPLGPKIGSDRLVATAQRFGFNSQPALYNAAATAAVNPPASTIPPQIGSDLELGVTAIGQGKLLATPLEMASVAQTIAAGGVRSPTPIVSEAALRPAAKPTRVVSPQIAATLKQLMLGVVAYGTGTPAKLSGVKVAGKTGTAELGPKPGQSPAPTIGPDGQPQPGKPEQIVDAWFAGFAPANKPRLAICVLIADASGDGGEVAAPIARDLLAIGLRSSR